MKCIEQIENKLKVKKENKLILIEKKDDEELAENQILAPRFYTKNGRLYIILRSDILAEFDAFNDALYYLFGLYFAFDLHYPQCFLNLLGLFHEFLFQKFRNIDFPRSTNYKSIVSFLKKHI